MMESLEPLDGRAAHVASGQPPRGWAPSSDQLAASAAIAATYPPIDNVFDGSRPVVIAPAARMARAFVGALRREGVSPVALADNDPDKWGTTVDGIPVLAPDEAFARYPNAAVCVASLIVESEVAGQMRQLGFPAVYPLSVLHHYRPDVFVAPYLNGAFSSTFDPAHAKAIEDVAALWADDESAWTFQQILTARRTLALDIYAAIRAGHPQYFPPDVVTFTEDDVFCDAGAFIGDTLTTFRSLFPSLAIPYYAFEPDPANYARLSEAGADYPGKFVAVQGGLGAQEATMRFAATGGMDGRFATGDSGPTLRIHQIDQFFPDDAPPTFIKMDIEGMEREALAGGERIIRSHAPTLAICVYHEPTDLWEIPKWVHERQPRYRFYLRHYSTNMSETVMFAVAR
jgi:FkbM family methyltransferase